MTEVYNVIIENPRVAEEYLLVKTKNYKPELLLKF